MCTGDMHKPFGPSLHLCAPLNDALTGPETHDWCVRKAKKGGGGGGGGLEISCPTCPTRFY